MAEFTCDLGVNVTSDLSHLHVNNIVAKAHKCAAAVLRAFISRGIKLTTRAFLVYDRPIIEYNSIIWSPLAIRASSCIRSDRRSRLR